MMNGRLPWLDAARCLACLCVLLVHVTYAGGIGGRVAIAIYDYYGVSGASVVFFMITGALTLWTPRPLGGFMRKRLLRVVLPMVIWSAVTLLLYTCLGRIAWADLPRRLLLIAVEPQVPQFWFIYVVTGIYLVAPILATWLQSATRRQVEWLLVAWAATLCLPWVSMVWPEAEMVVSRQHGSLFYFQGYLGFALLGYYIRRWVTINRRMLWLTAGVLLALFPLALRGLPLPASMFTSRLSPNVVALSFVLLVLIKHFPIPSRACHALQVAGQLTFGIYLVHMPIVRLVVTPMMEYCGLNYWVGLPLATLLTAVLCALVVWLLSLTPCARVLGCELKNA